MFLEDGNKGNGVAGLRQGTSDIDKEFMDYWIKKLGLRHTLVYSNVFYSEWIMRWFKHFEQKRDMSWPVVLQDLSGFCVDRLKQSKGRRTKTNLKAIGPILVNNDSDSGWWEVVRFWIGNKDLILLWLIRLKTQPPNGTVTTNYTMYSSTLINTYIFLLIFLKIWRKIEKKPKLCSNQIEKKKGRKRKTLKR